MTGARPGGRGGRARGPDGTAQDQGGRLHKGLCFAKDCSRALLHIAYNLSLGVLVSGFADGELPRMRESTALHDVLPTKSIIIVFRAIVWAGVWVTFSQRAKRNGQRDWSRALSWRRILTYRRRAPWPPKHLRDDCKYGCSFCRRHWIFTNNILQGRPGTLGGC